MMKSISIDSTLYSCEYYILSLLNTRYYMRKIVVFLIALSAILTFSCSNNSDDDPIHLENTIGTQGGTIEITDTNSPIFGAKIEIPEGALDSDTHIKIDVTTETIPLPDNLAPSGPVVKLSPDGQTFNHPITITIPYFGDDLPIVASYEPNTSQFSILPIIETNVATKKVTVTTTHFSNVAGVVLSTINSVLTDADTLFSVGNDGFKIYNKDPVLSSIPGAADGVCHGITFFSQWYYINKKEKEGNLYNKFGSMEKWVAYEAQKTQSSEDAEAQAKARNATAAQTFLSLYFAMKSTNNPQAITVSDGSEYHAYLATSIEKQGDQWWDISIYDPNQTTGRNIIYDVPNEVFIDYLYQWRSFGYVSDSQYRGRTEREMQAIYNKYDTNKPPVILGIMPDLLSLTASDHQFTVRFNQDMTSQRNYWCTTSSSKLFYNFAGTAPTWTTPSELTYTGNFYPGITYCFYFNGTDKYPYMFGATGQQLPLNTALNIAINPYKSAPSISETVPANLQNIPTSTTAINLHFNQFMQTDRSITYPGSVVTSMNWSEDSYCSHYALNLHSLQPNSTYTLVLNPSNYSAGFKNTSGIALPMDTTITITTGSS
jgi:hypothetical protein